MKKSLLFLMLALTIPMQAKNVHKKPKYNYKTRNIYVNSIPKCGTHLLMKCIELLTGRPYIELPYNMVATDSLPKTYNNEFLATHVRYSPQAAKVFKKSHFKTFLIYRDPRDTLVSKVYWLYKGGFNNRLRNNPMRSWPFDKVLTHYIKTIYRQYKAFLPWLKDSRCCGVRFENLIGPQGGGTHDAQIREIKKIAKHIDVPLNETLLNHCINNLFGNTVTFRKGETQGWKQHFKPEHIQLFKAKANRLLLSLRYEEDGEW